MDIKLLPQWQQYLQLPESDWSLCDLALLVAEHLQPELDRLGYTHKLDDMIGMLAQRVKSSDDLTTKIQQLNNFFYVEQGFHSNADDYYNPENSLLNKVIDARQGIPISLAILYLRFAEAIGIQSFGISFPGHFLVGIDDDGEKLVIDPYDNGKQLDKSHLFELLAKAGMAISKPDDIDEYLLAASKRQIMARFLRNLKNIYIENQEVEKGLTVIELMLSLVGESPDELRDRGMIYYHLEYTQGALHDLQRYLALKPETSERNVIEAIIDTLTEHSTPLH
jgi:regulator of sirC expression with transglutaminase-like and TPR domain